MQKKIIVMIIIALVCLSIQGCAVFMAAKQPNRKDTSLFSVGTSRNLLLAEFGNPVVSEERDGKKYEIFSFIQGYSRGVKTGRALFHGAADFFTLGLWEFIGTPAEGILDGSEVAYEVSYDDKDQIEKVALLKKK